jgi:hypothetical protein
MLRRAPSWEESFSLDSAPFLAAKMLSKYQQAKPCATSSTDVPQCLGNWQARSYLCMPCFKSTGWDLNIKTNLVIQLLHIEVVFLHRLQPLNSVCEVHFLRLVGERR